MLRAVETSSVTLQEDSFALPYACAGFDILGASSGVNVSSPASNVNNYSLRADSSRPESGMKGLRFQLRTDDFQALSELPRRW